jgi:hypothetical protein
MEKNTQDPTPRDAVQKLVESAKANKAAPERPTVTSSDELQFDPGAFQRVFQKFLAPAGDGTPPPKMRMRTVSVKIWPEVCLPETFTEPFKVNMRELTSQIEIDVMTSIRGTRILSDGDDDRQDDSVAFGSAMGMMMAKASIYGVNGRNLTPDEINWLWDAIGQGGRTIIVQVFTEHCSGVSGDLIARSLASVEIG